MKTTSSQGIKFADTTRVFANRNLLANRPEVKTAYDKKHAMAVKLRSPKYLGF